MTRYLASLVAHDPKQAPLAANARFTEDSEVLPIGGGLWKTASKLRPFRTDFPDVRAGVAAVHAVIEENGSPVLFAPDAYRFENGVRMAGPGCTFRPPSCENMRGQQLPTLAGIQASVVAVDEENGTVLLYMDFGKGSLPGPDSAGKSLVTFEAFKAYGGQMHAVEAVLEGRPSDTPRGWK
jgi:hypothetical protein